MIFVTRLDGKEVVVNIDLVVTIERTPDTLLTLTTGDRILVKESLEQIVERAVAYRHRAMQGPGVRDGLSELAAALRAEDERPAEPTPSAQTRSGTPGQGED